MMMSLDHVLACSLDAIVAITITLTDTTYYQRLIDATDDFEKQACQ